MMGRKKFVGALVVGAMSAAPAMADVYSERIVQQLEAQGFRGISTERTWLGRTRITAEGRDGQREIIVNPNTGEILRDLLLAGNGGGSGRSGLVNVSQDNDDEDDDNDSNGGKSSSNDDKSSSNDDKSSSNGDKSSSNGDKSNDRSGSGRDRSGGDSGGSNGGDSD